MLLDPKWNKEIEKLDEPVLPRVLSKLIDIALADLEKVERMPKYKVNMDYWHVREYEQGGCLVCFAGAVMACRLNAIPGESYIPGNFLQYSYQLKALDQLRRGQVGRAADSIKSPPPPSRLRFHYIPEYAANPNGFKSALRDLSAKLREVGL